MSVIPVEQTNNPTKMKANLMRNDPVKEETRPFLNFSRENLNISQADLEQGFHRSRLRPTRNTILSSLALTIAVLCLSLEGWKLQYSLSNAREIELLKRNVESLKHRFLQQNLMNELKAFEQQLYGEVSEDNERSEAEIDNIDYDSEYSDDDDDDNSASHDYHSLTTTPASKSSDLAKNTSTSASTSESNKTISGVLTSVRKAQTDRREELEKTYADRVEDERKVRFTQEQIDKSNNSKRKRDIVARDTMNMEYVGENSKAKRFVSDRALIDDTSADAMKYQHSGQREAKMTTLRVDSNASAENDRDDDFDEDSTSYMNEEVETAGSDGRTNWQNAHLVENGTNHQKQSQNGKKNSRKVGRKLIRRNLRTPRQVRAIHYGADSTLFTVNDEHSGNGRARHSSGVFKAWRASDWVVDLGMDRFFSLGNDGKLTVHESGLYLVYAQIHYLDEHDENGFHLLVNDRPVLQCMVFSPGVGHKSRSCFSGQVIVLHSGDHLILKEVGSARYTLFQHDKSFFGLVKLGEARHQSRQMPQVTHRENKTL